MAEIIVTSTADSGTGTLRQAIADAKNDDVILFDSEVFPINSSTVILVNSTIGFSKNLTIDATPAKTNYAVYRDGEIVDVDGNEDALNGETPFLKITPRVVLDGNLSRSTINTGGSSVFKGLGFRRGYANTGAGFSAWNGFNRFEDCSFVDNETRQSATYEKGAGLGFESNTKGGALSRCYFANNKTNRRGGALALIQNQNYAVDHCVFVGNYSTGIKTDAHGGAVVTAGSVEFSDCLFIGNSIKNNHEGGAVYAESGTLSLIRCEFVDNEAQRGDAFYVDANASASIQDCVLKGQEIVVDGSSATVSGGNVLKSLVLGSGAAVTLVGEDTFLSVAESATIDGSATISHATRGYFAVPSTTDVSAVTLTNVVRCDYGAGASQFRSANGLISWDATAPTVGVLVERQNAGAWTTLAASATSYDSELTIGDLVRIFDGQKFLTTTVNGLVKLWTVEAWAEFEWTVEAWAENLGGGGADDAAYTVEVWGIAPQKEHR